MIELKHLTKKYDHFLAVSDLNLKIETGEFFGLLGPNGAGKTCLLYTSYRSDAQASIDTVLFQIP